MKYELDPAFVSDVAAAVVKCLDEMSGSGTTADERQQFVVAMINRINDPPPAPPEVEPQSVATNEGGDLGVDVVDDVNAKVLFGG